MAKKKATKKNTKKSVKSKKVSKKSSKKATPKKTSSKKSVTKKTVSKKPTKKKSASKKVSLKVKVAPTSAPSNVELKTGDTAPAFGLKNQNGQTISLASLNGKKVVLYFYPKDLTPGCTIEACDFRDSLERIQSKNTVVLGVSKDDEALHQKFIEKHNLNFDLLADTEGKVCDAYGVMKEKNMYGKKFIGISRTTFIIKDGKIAKVYPNVKVEGHVQQILNDLESL